MSIIEVADVEMVEKLREELVKYGIILPKQIKTPQGAKRYLETQIRTETSAIEALKRKIEAKEIKIQIIESVLKEMELYRKKEIVK